MKARVALDLIQKVNPDDEVIMLLWTKDTFDDEQFREENILTDKAWKKVVVTMEDEGGIDSGDQQISEIISELVSEYSEPDLSIFDEETQ
jgi:hypothetical protein